MRVIRHTWTTYQNDEYGFSVSYPIAFGGNPVNIIQEGNKFFIRGKNTVGNEFEIPITIGTNVKSEEDIDQFIKQKYGSSCKLAEVHYDDSKDGFFPVSAYTGQDEDPPCWINWVTIMKFSPEKQK